MQSAANTDEFVRLFSLYAKSVYSYIHVLVPTHADAEDLFQETSRTMWQKFGQYGPGPDEGFRAWALRIALRCSATARAQAASNAVQRSTLSDCQRGDLYDGRFDQFAAGTPGRLLSQAA